MNKLKKLLIILSVFIGVVFIYFSISLGANIDLGMGHADQCCQLKRIMKKSTNSKKDLI